MINKGLFTCNRCDWETPKELYDKLNKEFDFTLDPCSNEFNHKCDKYYTIKDNGLFQNWDNERVFMNPPYGDNIPAWIKKAYYTKGIVVCLIPSRTDTKYWHNYVMKAKKKYYSLRGGLSLKLMALRKIPRHSPARSLYLMGKNIITL